MSYGAAEGCKLYVGNLGYDTRSDTLHAAFAPFGNIQEASVASDRETGQSRGFGFVTYSSPMEAQAAMDNLNGTELDGRTIRVNLSQPRYGGSSGGYGGSSGGAGGYGGSSGGYGGGAAAGGYGGGGGGFGGGGRGGGDGNKLFIGNLGWSTTTDELYQAFSQYGQIQDAIVMTDRETGSSRGFGFVTYTDAGAAQAAIQGMDGRDFGGRSIRVNISEPKQRF
ncbi:hypothetical protein JKP88DRAFT_163534 [Tribonema minus]|uniref:RRM domain-containing protein n=1 Tax=Tribonema minus TaxID=303371 RepID=A0A835Z0H8_9STRA|nr:hypothetical protein JKP88DRAFT_163534 [Tribonema minus]